MAEVDLSSEMRCRACFAHHDCWTWIDCINISRIQQRLLPPSTYLTHLKLMLTKVCTSNLEFSKERGLPLSKIMLIFFTGRKTHGVFLLLFEEAALLILVKIAGYQSLLIARRVRDSMKRVHEFQWRFCDDGRPGQRHRIWQPTWTGGQFIVDFAQWDDRCPLCSLQQFPQRSHKYLYFILFIRQSKIRSESSSLYGFACRGRLAALGKRKNWRQLASQIIQTTKTRLSSNRKKKAAM